MLALCTVIISLSLAFGQVFELKTNNDAPWGDWKAQESCPDGQFARGISLYVVPEQGGETWFAKNDDWAANLIGLRCSHDSCDMSPPGEYSYPGTNSEWWRDVVCPCPGFITAFRQKVEPPQGDGDDTALNSVQIRCSDGTVLEPSNGGRWGNWGEWSNACPVPGWYVNGLMRKNEDWNSDNTGLNGVRMYCGRKLMMGVDGWHMGRQGAICDHTCQDLGLQCDADMQSTINSHIVANGAFAAAGYQCKVTDPILHRDYAGTPFRVENGDCYHLSSGAKSVCNANALPHHWPLCYCRRAASRLLL